MKTAFHGVRWLRTLVAIGLVVSTGLQFVPTRRTNPPAGARLEAPAEVEAVLRRACYDCHSHETRWPWYSYVAPVSWWVIRHVEHGRGDLNFSQWPVLDFEAESWALRDIEEQIVQGKMPLKSYTWMHREAQLDDSERTLLLRWVRGEI